MEIIDFYADWCGPCQMECPHLEAAWKKYGSRVAFIALSAEPNDTMETATSFRKEFAVTFPMGIDEGRVLYSRSDRQGYPQTIVVDRFGNVGFYQYGAFSSAAQVERVLDWFLGDNYTQTSVLEEIPPDTSTDALPLSAKRTVSVENEGVREINIRLSNPDRAMPCYIVPDETARIRIEIGTNDSLFRICYMDYWNGSIPVTDLYDPERGAFIYEQEIEGTLNGKPHHFSYGCLLDEELYIKDPDMKAFFVIREEQYVDDAIELLTQSGYSVTGWEYAEEDATAEANIRTEGSALQAYILHAADQYGNPGPEVTVNFCTSTACIPEESDENGLIVFDGSPDVYHVQLVDVPDGYSYDDGFELYTGPEYGEWVLRVKKDN